MSSRGRFRSNQSHLVASGDVIIICRETLNVANKEKIELWVIQFYGEVGSSQEGTVS